MTVPDPRQTLGGMPHAPLHNLFSNSNFSLTLLEFGIQVWFHSSGRSYINGLHILSQNPFISSCSLTDEAHCQT